MAVSDAMVEAALMAFYGNDWTRGVGSPAMRRALAAADAARDNDLAARVFAIAYPTNAQFEMSQPERIADAARRLDQIAELTKPNRLPAPSAAPPAGTVALSAVVRCDPKGFVDGRVLPPEQDPVAWASRVGGGRTENGPIMPVIVRFHAPLPDAPDVRATVEPRP